MLFHEKIEIGMLSNLKPTVNFANKMTAEPGQVWGPRTIPDCQLIYIVSGKASLTLGSEIYNLNPGESVFYGENSPHKLISTKSEPFTFTSIHFNWDSKSPKPIHPLSGIKECSLSDLGNQVPSYHILVEEHGEIKFPNHFILPHLEPLFLKIVREYRFEEPGYTFVLRGLLTQLLTVIIRNEMNGGYSSGERRKIAPALEAIRKQPNKNWSSSELADLCGYHPTYFASIFKETIGFSPKHYLIQERIRKAKQLLIEMKTIEEVSINLGYTSLHYFCRNFKTVTGLTPSEYKLQSIEL
jgi:AraC family transcriptional regulator, activator of mtrCDE